MFLSDNFLFLLNEHEQFYSSSEKLFFRVRVRQNSRVFSVRSPGYKYDEKRHGCEVDRYLFELISPAICLKFR